MCNFRHRISHIQGSLQTRFYIQGAIFDRFDPVVMALPVIPGDRRQDIRVSCSHITYSMCNCQDRILNVKGTLQVSFYIQGAIFDHFDPVVMALPDIAGDRRPDIRVFCDHIAYSICCSRNRILNVKGTLQRRAPYSVGLSDFDDN